MTRQSWGWARKVAKSHPHPQWVRLAQQQQTAKHRKWAARMQSHRVSKDTDSSLTSLLFCCCWRRRRSSASRCCCICCCCCCTCCCSISSWRCRSSISRFRSSFRRLSCSRDCWISRATSLFDGSFSRPIRKLSTEGRGKFSNKPYLQKASFSQVSGLSINE